MTDIAYEADGRRLRVEGRCRDARPVCDALETFTRDAATLTVDLTRVTEMDAHTASTIVDAIRTAEGRGCRVTVVRKHGSDVDALLEQLAR